MKAKLIAYIAKKASKKLPDITDPVTQDTISFFVDIAKEIIKPY